MHDGSTGYLHRDHDRLIPRSRTKNGKLGASSTKIGPEVECDHRFNHSLDFFTSQIRDCCYSQAHSGLWQQNVFHVLESCSDFASLHGFVIYLVVQAMQPNRLPVGQIDSWRKLRVCQCYDKPRIRCFGILSISRPSFCIVSDPFHYATEHAT